MPLESSGMIGVEFDLIHFSEEERNSALGLYVK